MELDATTITAISVASGGILTVVGGGIGWVCNRVDKQFAAAKAEAEEARNEIKKDLDECDKKHQKCEEDRQMIREEVIGLRVKVDAVARSQGFETRQQAKNTADIESLKDHRADGTR
jgi:hypothetical protein